MQTVCTGLYRAGYYIFNCAVIGKYSRVYIESCVPLIGGRNNWSYSQSEMELLYQWLSVDLVSMENEELLRHSELIRGQSLNQEV